MPYRQGAPAPSSSSLLCGICHAALERTQATVDDARLPLCERCARARRRARGISYAFVALVLAAGIAGALTMRARRQMVGEDDERRVVEQAAERVELTRVRRLLEDGRLSDAREAALAGLHRFGPSSEWSSLQREIESVIDTHEREAAMNRGYHSASPRPTLPVH